MYPVPPRLAPPMYASDNHSNRSTSIISITILLILTFKSNLYSILAYKEYKEYKEILKYNLVLFICLNLIILFNKYRSMITINRSVQNPFPLIQWKQSLNIHCQYSILKKHT